MLLKVCLLHLQVGSDVAIAPADHPRTPSRNFTRFPYLRVRPASSCGIAIAGESSEHKPDAGEANEGDGGSVEVFVVLGLATSSASVWSSRTATSATFAVKAAENFRRFALARDPPQYGRILAHLSEIPGSALSGRFSTNFRCGRWGWWSRGFVVPAVVLSWEVGGFWGLGWRALCACASGEESFAARRVRSQT